MSYDTETFYIRFVQWLKSKGYAFTGDDPTYTGGNIIKPGTIDDLLLQWGLRQRLISSGFPIEGLLWGSLAIDHFSGTDKADTYLFSDFGDFDATDHVITDTGTNMTFSSTLGLQKTAAAGADFVDIDIATDISGFTYLVWFDIARATLATGTYFMQFVDSGGTKFGMNWRDSTPRRAVNLRNDAASGNNAYHTNIDVSANDWVIQMCVWDLSAGEIHSYAIADTGIFEHVSNTSLSGTFTWTSSIDTVTVCNLNMQEFRMGMMYLDVLYTESDFWRMARIAADWAREAGITFPLLREGGQSFHSYIGSSYTLTASWAKVTGWTSVVETNAYSFASNEVTIQDPGVYRITAHLAFNESANGGWNVEGRISRDTGGGYAVITGAESRAQNWGAIGSNRYANMSIETVARLNTGDKVCVQAQEVDSTDTPDIDYGQFNIERIM